MATRPASLRVRIGAAVAALLLLVGIVASLFGGVSNQTTTTSTASSAPPTTISDEDFGQIAGGITTLIEQAGTQRCPLISAYTAFGELPDPPANAAQVRQAVDVTVALLEATAASAGPDEAASAEVIAATAANLRAEAEQAGYSPAWITSPQGIQTLNDPAFTTAFEAYQQQTEQLCVAAGTDGSGSTPTAEGSEAPS